MGDDLIEPPHPPQHPAPPGAVLAETPTPPPPQAIGGIVRRFDRPLILAGRLVLAAAVIQLIYVGWAATMASRRMAYDDGRLSLSRLQQWYDWDQIAVGATMVALVPAAIATFVALVRVYDAATTFARIDFGRWRIIWGWFVPIASLFVPYKVMRKFFDVTCEPSVSLGLWWGLMITSTQMTRFIFRADSPVAVEVLSAIDGAVLGVAGFLFVRLLDDLRVGLHDQLDRRSPQAPTIVG